MNGIDTWSSVQMRSFIIKQMWYMGEMQDLDFADLLTAVKHTQRTKDWVKRFAAAYKLVLDDYYDEEV